MRLPWGLLGAGAVVGCLPEPVPTPVPEELQLAELMIAPLHDDVSWIELLNQRSTAIEGADIEVELSSGVYTLDEVGPLAPGDAVAFGRGPGLALDLPDLSIDPAGDTVVLRVQGVEIDRVTWDRANWPAPEGASITRTPSWVPADDPLGWCDAWTPQPDGDFASPGVRNLGCGCALPYDFELIQQVPPNQVVTGSVEIRLAGDGTFEGDGDTGPAERWTDAGGQHVEWVFSTGVTYRGTRGFGDDRWVDQPIEVPPSVGDYVGSWTSAPCGSSAE